MSSLSSTARTRVWLGRIAALLSFSLHALAGSAWAQDDPPGRVGRLTGLQGEVSWFDHERGQWEAAERNRPLTSGDRVSTGREGRAELRVGSTALRVAEGTEVEVLRIDDDHLRFQLHAGSVALRVRSRELAREVEIVTAEARLRPQRPGHYRVDRIDDTTHAGSWRGSLRFRDGEGYLADTGQRVELWLEGSPGELRHAWSRLPDDAFARWALEADRGDERSAAQRYVSPEMTGAEDLDRYGRWDRHPEYGAVWIPLAVRVDWAPYRWGRWNWVLPWGWTWVDEAPWGFAPFHYGRWVHWGGRWGWAPGHYVARPTYAPALVAWVGGAHWGVSVNIGAPAVGWVPLAPREVFVPYYRSTPVYVDRVNVRPPRHPHPSHPGHRPAPPAQVPTGPIMYGNQGVPGAVTVVPSAVLVQRQPVSPAVVDAHRGGALLQPLPGAAPPQPLAPARAPALPAAPARVADPASRALPPVPVGEPSRVRPVPRHRVAPPTDAPAAPAAVARAQPTPAAPPSPPTQRAMPSPAAPAAPAAQIAPLPASNVAPAPGKPAAPAPDRRKEPDEERKRAPESRNGMRERSQLQ